MYNLSCFLFLHVEQGFLLVPLSFSTERSLNIARIASLLEYDSLGFLRL